MIYPSFVIKRHAKMAMRGNFLKALGATMLPALIVSVIAVMLLFLPPAAEVIDNASSVMFGTTEEQMRYTMELINNLIYAINLLVALFYFLVIGGEKVCLDIVRGKKAQLKSIFSFYEKWYIACIWPAITLALTVAANLLTDYAVSSGAPDMAVELVLMAWELVSLIISVKTMFIPYALADDGCRSFAKAFLKSWKVVNMKCIVSIFLLYMSFIGWFILVFFTGIAIIYVYPYMKLSMATLYYLTTAQQNS